LLERLLYRARTVAAIRVLVLLPTRELAVQCFEVTRSIAQFTDIQVCLLAGKVFSFSLSRASHSHCDLLYDFLLDVGGLSYKQQEQELKRRPDILIATPGRLIDHIKNSASFSLESIEILVLDEADRMLEVGFQEELEEIIMNCPSHRQTMLFSATMTDNISQLVTLSLKKPVKLFVDSSDSIAANLVQEFIRVRVDTDRPAMTLALCKHYYTQKVIVFIPSKVETHRMRVLFGLFGLKAAELHGNLNQAQVRKMKLPAGHLSNLHE